MGKYEFNADIEFGEWGEQLVAQDLLGYNKDYRYDIPLPGRDSIPTKLKSKPMSSVHLKRIQEICSLSYTTGENLQA